MRGDSRADELAEAFRARIRQGALPIGARLPSEQAIAADWSVSRTVVREAVARLKSDGLVETRQGAPTRVRSPVERGAAEAAALGAPRSIEGLLGFLEVRRAVEAEMAACAAERRTAAQCRAIEAALGAIDVATDRGEDGVAADLAFHVAIGAATANGYWVQFMRLFAGPMRLAIGLTRANERRRGDFSADVAAEHRRIAAAIRARDPADARAAATQHIAKAAGRVLQADGTFWRDEGGALAADWAAQTLRTRSE